MPTQLHRRLDDDQVRTILSAYDRRELVLAAAISQLGVGRRQFFRLLQEYRSSSGTFSIAYVRRSSARLSRGIEHRIRGELEKEILYDTEVHRFRRLE